MSKTTIAIIVVTLALVGLLGYYFFSSAQSAPMPSPKPVSQATQTPALTKESTSTADLANKNTILITSSEISPQRLTIKRGDTVTWKNNDSVNHQINSAPHPVHTDYPPLNSIGLLTPGDQKSLSFPESGTFKFHDHLNPSLFGSIIVQ